MDKKELLERAKKHCFFIGLNDSGAELCKANSPYGIAAIHHIQEELGKKADATFIFTPDMTITRNITRWTSGFGYGGKVTWGNGEDDLVILNVKPNACGTLMGGLKELPDIDKLINKLHNMEKDNIKIDGTQVHWDFYKSNHFIDLFQAKAIIKLDFEMPPYSFVIHGSAGELMGDSNSGFGLYYDKSKELYKMAEHVETPFGEFHILTGENAGKYFERYKYIDSFAKRKRKLAAEMLFGDFTEITNETHQGMINMNEIILGCHYTSNGKLFPLTLRGDLPAYLVRGLSSLSPETIDMLGFENRAKKLGVYDRLLNANILPHGGGYVLPDILGVNKVIEIEGKRYFEVDMQNDRGKKIISEVRELPYEYRGRKVILRAMEANLLEILVKLIPLYVIKL